MKKIYKFILIILCCVILHTAISDNFMSISGNSMYPTLKDKQVVKVSKTKEINRFDIVIAKKHDNYLIVKRVIGLPNEKVEYKDNHLYINDKPVTEDFIDLYSTKTENFVYTLKDNEYFLLGDNREYSTDSREHGPFRKEEIIYLVSN